MNILQNTNSITMESKENFVRKLNLSAPSNKYEENNKPKSRAKPEEAAEKGDEAFIADKGIISFATGVPPQYTQDVLNSVLLAQFAANAAFPKKEHLEMWYEEYIRVLSGIGWVIGKSRI